MTRRSASAFTSRSTRTRCPFASSISMSPDAHELVRIKGARSGAGGGNCSCSGAICTAANFVGFTAAGVWSDGGPASWRRQRNRTLVCTPYFRATLDMELPAAKVSSTSCSF
jgi:hypothetical protein